MQKTNSDTSMKDAIQEIKHKQAEEVKLLKEQFHLVYESIQPINIIKKTFKEAAGSEELKENILNTSLGLLVGYLSKALFEDVKISPLKKLLGTAILFGMTQIVAKNPETVKSIGKRFLQIILKKQSHRLSTFNH